MSMKALGLIEAIGLSTAITAADAAVKSANVKLLGYENTKGGGKITIKLVGDVGAVQAALAAAQAAGSGLGGIAATQCIARPHDELEALIRAIDCGAAKPEPESAVQKAPVEAEETEKSAKPEGDGKAGKNRK